MQYSVIPLLRLPRTAPDTFSYTSPTELRAGTLVRIPFRNKKIFGVIADDPAAASLRPHEQKILPIHASFEKIFSEQQLNFFKAVQKESFEHLGTIIRTIYNKVQWTRITNHESPHHPATAGGTGQARITNPEKKRKKCKKEYHIYSSPQERIDFFLEHVTHAQKLKRSLLIIIPEYEDALKVYEEIKKEGTQNGEPLRKSFFFISSKTSAREYTELFLRTDPCIVVSSRIGIFLPNDFQTVLCDDEPNPRYMHEESAPAYDVRAIAEKRARIFGSKFILSGYSIRNDVIASEVAVAASGAWRVTIPREMRLPRRPALMHKCGTPRNDNQSKTNTRIIPCLAPLTLVNLVDEQQKGNIIFSEPVKILAKKHPLLFILNSRDFSKKIACRACGYTFLCPACTRPFRAETEYNLRCIHCRTSAVLPPLCPHCSSGDFAFSGMGAKQFEQRIKETLKNKKKHAVATFTSLGALDLSPFRAIVIPFFESFMTAQYAVTEQLAHSLFKLRKRLSGEIIIQHFSEKGAAFLVDLEKTLREDDGFRKAFQYPPYGDVYRIRKKQKIKKTKKPSQEPKTDDQKKKDLECVASVFGVTPEKIVYSAFRKRGLSIGEFIVKIPLKKEINFRALPQDFHIVKNPVFL